MGARFSHMKHFATLAPRVCPLSISCAWTNWGSGWSKSSSLVAADVRRLHPLRRKEGRASIPRLLHRLRRTPPGLLASLDKLDEVARQVLLRLGDFQGGALEDDLIARSQCWAKT